MGTEAPEWIALDKLQLRFFVAIFPSCLPSLPRFTSLKIPILPRSRRNECLPCFHSLRLLSASSRWLSSFTTAAASSSPPRPAPTGFPFSKATFAHSSSVRCRRLLVSIMNSRKLTFETGSRRDDMAILLSLASLAIGIVSLVLQLHDRNRNRQ
jgi:hypothetical protein